MPAEKVRPWIQRASETLHLAAIYECPDCKRAVLSDGIEDYDYCPICGKRRTADD